VTLSRNDRTVFDDPPTEVNEADVKTPAVTDHHKSEVAWGTPGSLYLLYLGGGYYELQGWVPPPRR